MVLSAAAAHGHHTTPHTSPAPPCPPCRPLPSHPPHPRRLHLLHDLLLPLPQQEFAQRAQTARRARTLQGALLHFLAPLPLLAALGGLQLGEQLLQQGRTGPGHLRARGMGGMCVGEGGGGLLTLHTSI